MGIELIIDIIASIIGFVSIGFLISLNKKLGGKMSQAIYLFVSGITFMVLAFVWSIVFGHGDLSVLNSSTGMTNVSSGSMIDVHHVLMAIGMIFFIFSARKFSSLIKND